MSSNLTWFDSPGYSYQSYIVSIVFTSPDIKAENVLSTEKNCVFVHASAGILLQLLNSLTIQKSEKIYHRMQHALFMRSITIDSRLQSTNNPHS